MRKTRQPTRQTNKSSETFCDAAASKAARLLSYAIIDEARDQLKCSLFKKSLMLRGDLLASEIDDSLINAVIGKIRDEGMRLPILSTKTSHCARHC